ncbi:MAG: rhomboid family intramembrane serine protease [Allosphingosinicella sp.]
MRSAPVTLAIAVATFVAWFLAWGIGWDQELAWWGGFIPARLEAGADPPGPWAPVFLTPLTATLLHANFIHIAFNLLILFFCGRSVEPILGGTGIAVLYLVGAFAAAAAHWAANVGEAVPMIGASGAVSALLGAYALLFGRNKVKVASPAVALWLHALWLAAAWIGLQLLIGFTFEGTPVRIAIFAHVGGFLAGLLLAKPLLLWRYRGA